MKDFTFKEKYSALIRFNGENILSLVLDTEQKTVSVILTDADGDKRYIGLLELEEEE